MSLDEFSTDSMKIYQLKQNVDGGSGFYIYSADFGWETLDSFIRCMEEDEAYYIGGIIDYHY